MPHKPNGPSDSSLSSVDFTDLDALAPVGKYAFVFVCQRGRLEIQALLLAASLRRHLRCDHELIAAVPDSAKFMGSPRDESLALLRSLGVRIETVENEFVSSPLDATTVNLYANKIFCLGVATDADKLIFLDSDMLCFKDFHGDARYRIPLNAKLVGMAGVVTTVGRWRALYDLANLPLPPARLRVIGIEEGLPKSAFVPPYFNSGFVAVHAGAAQKLRDAWKDCFKLVRDSGLLDEVFLAEQVSLPLAVHRLNLVFDVMKVEDLPTFHYHRLPQLQANAGLLRLARELVGSNERLQNIIEQEPEWSCLLPE